MRKILHCDLNNFFAAVEQVVNPDINAKYIAVSGSTDTRHGIILAKNTAAKQMGVKTGQAIWQAKQLCPQLVCLAPHYEYYAHYSKLVREIYKQYTDMIESMGMDECWLDVTHSGCFGTAEQIADIIRNRVREELGLTISVGVSFNKVFAKLGSDMKKPDAVTVISADNYKQVVWTLPVSQMIGIGNKTEVALNAMGIYTLGQLAQADTNCLQRKFGIVGVRMQQCALGLDDEPVKNIETPRIAKSVGHGTTTLRDMTTFNDIDKVVTYLSDMVATRLRRYGMQGTVVHVNIRHNDLSVKGKQKTVKGTYVCKEISAAAMSLIKDIWHEGTSLPLRSLTVSVSNLYNVCDEQMSIWEIADEKAKRLEYSLDLIRKKYGYCAIKKACLLDNDLISDKFFIEEDVLPFKKS